MKLFSNRWAVAAMGLLGAVGLCTRAGAQCGDYFVNPSSDGVIVGADTDIGNHNDDATVPISLPFTFNFYGQDYTTAYVCSNGWMSFSANSGTGYANPCLPGGSPASFAAVPGPVMFPFWDDNYTFDAADGQGIFSTVTGTAPNRQFIVEWRTVFCCGNGVPVNDYEVVLYEGSNGFDFVYGAMADRGSATIGVQQDGVAGSTFTQYSCNVPESLQGTRLHFDCFTGPHGACCAANGGCSIQTPELCASAGGLYHGDGTTCVGSPCTGRCCSPDGTCQVISQQACGAISGATYSAGVNTCAGTYTLTSGNTAMEDISSSGAVLFGDGTAPSYGTLDDGSSVLAIPFNFSFFGNAYTQMQVGTNGYVTFDMTLGNGSIYGNGAGIPATSVPNNLIGAPWDDFYLVNQGDVRWQVDGTTPNQRLIIQWTNVQYFSTLGTGSTFQIILYETSNNVEIRLGTFYDGEPTTDPNKVMGLENSDGTIAVAVPWPGNNAAAGTSYTFAYSSGCPAHNFCCVSDYNGDGDTGTDADIEDFFRCLAGNCCATCPPDSDFNCDGDSGTDADIESFFRVLAGGSC